MPTFTFRLQSLLDQKIEAVKTAKLALAERQRELEEQQAALMRLIEAENTIQQQIKASRETLLTTSGADHAPEVHRRNNFLAGLQQDLSIAHGEMLVQKFAVEEAEATLEHARKHLIECSREAEKLDKYREKQQHGWLAEQAKKEAIEQDELGTVMYLNRRADV